MMTAGEKSLLDRQILQARKADAELDKEDEPPYVPGHPQLGGDAAGRFLDVLGKIVKGFKEVVVGYCPGRSRKF